MSDVEVRVEGAEETIAALRRLDDAVSRKIVPKGLRVGGRILEAAAIAQAPDKSGLTRSKIKSRSSTRRGVSRVSVGLDARDYTGEAFYASFLVFGHKAGPRKVKKGSKRKWRLTGSARHIVPANNFLARAAQIAGEQAVAAAVDAWQRGIAAAAANKGNAT